MVYSYPFVNGAGQDVTVDAVHYFLKTPSLVAKRVATLAQQRFISDFLLQGRYNAEGGGISYLVDDGLFSDATAEVIAPGAEYPLTTASEGTPQSAPTEKDGQDSEIYDESIAHMLLDPVNRALAKMVNRMIKRVDAKNLSVISSLVTQTSAAGAAWTSADQIIEDVLGADAKLDALDLGLSGDVVALKPSQFAKVAAKFVKADMVANGLSSVLATGVVPDVLGKTWVTSNAVPFTDPLLLDATQLGGIGTEDLRSPGYMKVTGALGIETKVQRLVGSDDRDGYRVRVRRVGVAAVVEPRAGIRITGTGV